MPKYSTLIHRQRAASVITVSEFAASRRPGDQASDGWRIVAVEQYREHEMLVDGSPFTIRGTIDRVDVNEQLGGKIAIWDYKTSDAGKSPAAVHYSKSKGWTDLQLPLYRYLVLLAAAFI